VEKEPLNALIVYTSNSPTLKELTKKLNSFINDSLLEVRVKPAAETEVPHVCAADIIFFGSDESGSTFGKGEFKELERAFAGINLAGKVAGLFSCSSTAAIDSLKEMLKSTGITIGGEPYLGCKKEDFGEESERIKKWVNEVINTYRERFENDG